MSSLCVSKVKLSELLNQVFEDLRGEFLLLFKSNLEAQLEAIRDQIIRTRRYHRGNVKKRWGYTVRKWIQTPIGNLEGIRIPRIRNHSHEISLFCDRYVKRSGVINALIIEMFLWGMSTHRLGVVSRKLYRVGLTATSISRLKRLVAQRVKDMREARISDEIKILVVDGLHGKYRGCGRGVCLLAIGVDEKGESKLLDWLGCEGESSANWRRLFRRLKARGLNEVKLVVSDDHRSIKEAINDVWGDDCIHQLCLWHLGEAMKRVLRSRSRGFIKHFMREYWKIFETVDVRMAGNRLQEFIHKWHREEPEAIEKLICQQEKLFLYFAYPEPWRRRLRTVNLAEGFFSQFRNLLRRFPGWIDENHIEMIVGIYIAGKKLFHHNQLNYHNPEIPANILNLNFNRIT